MGWILWALLILTTPAQTLAAIPLSQEEVARRVLKDSDHTEEARLAADLARVGLARAESRLDWSLSAESGYEISKPLRINSVSNLKDQNWRTQVTLKKPWSTGTLLGFEWSRDSQESEFNPASSSFGQYPPRSTLDELGITIEQRLLKNAFGLSDRSLIEAERKAVEAARMNRGLSLQDLVLSGIRKFWAAYVARENLREAQRAQEAYEKLVSTVRRRTSLGTTGPGELSQAQAELEGRKQKLKTAVLNELAARDELLTFLNLKPHQEIDFKVDKAVVPPPAKMEKISLENLRPLRVQALTKEAADLRLKSAAKDNNPELNLVGKLYGVGLEENSSSALGGALSGSHPRYFLGVQLTHTFGSGVNDEEERNRAIQSRIEELKLERLRRDHEIRLDMQEKRVESAHLIAKSAEVQKKFRERALREIQRHYNQGRIDIRNLIQAMNDAMDAEVAYSRSVGEYQMALAEWKALRDELIPEEK